ncbi:MAG TPA: D-alanyl-D-alanine carboxypeptidase, partial [Agriterribacter sp.]|nr:D-alanyl-D-alanine carboxypeptidase [Agriterribacter sp.]
MIRKKAPGLGNAASACILLMVALLPVTNIYAQTITQKLQKAFLRFEEDSQLAHAISSLYVTEAATGKVVFDKNARTGLAPASTQKIITSATAFALLGKDFSYTTSFAVSDHDRTLYIFPSGDPTLGSERWENTKANAILNRITRSLEQNKKNINTI